MHMMQSIDSAARRALTMGDDADPPPPTAPREEKEESSGRPGKRQLEEPHPETEAEGSRASAKPAEERITQPRKRTTVRARPKAR